ncbi:MAG TPA: ATP-binding protein [Actinomycetota bacterium]
MSDQIVIRIPASTPHVGLIRASASALAAHLDFTYDRITDLQIAIDEVCSRIMATSNPPATHLEVTFSIDERTLRVSAAGDRPLREGEDFLTTWSKAILDSVTDGVEIARQDGVHRVSFEVAGAGRAAGR